MDEFETKNERTTRDSRATFWLVIVMFLLLIGAAGTTMYYSHQQKNTISQLSSQTSDMNSTIGQLQGQLQSTTTKLNDVTAAQAAAAQQAQAAAAAAKSPARGAAGPSRAEAARLKQLQASLDDQQKQLQSTQDDVSKTRSDLEGNISSTRDELNGSIAKTHDELVLLEKRGEHRYFEFDLAKAKKFQKEGPLSLMLRREDPKHSNIDLTVLVNDKQITKRKVNLYEPVWIYDTDGGEPMQVVVNKIDSKGIHGYVSSPRYTQSDLAASATAAPDLTPATQQNPAPALTTPLPLPAPTPNANSTSGADQNATQ